MSTMLFREFWAGALDEDADHLVMQHEDEMVDHKTLADQGVTNGSLVEFIRSEVGYGVAVLSAVSGNPLSRRVATDTRTAEGIAARAWNTSRARIVALYQQGVGYVCVTLARPTGWVAIQTFKSLAVVGVQETQVVKACKRRERETEAMRRQKQHRRRGFFFFFE